MSAVPPEHLAAWRGILNAQARITRAAEEALAEHGLPPLSWYDALWPLARERRPMRMGELSRNVVTIGRSGLTRVLDRLVAEGLAARSRSASDARGTEISITPEGRALLRRMWRVYSAVLADDFVGRLTTEEALALGDLLERAADPGAARSAPRSGRG